MKSKLFLLLALAGSALFAQQAVTVAPDGTGKGTFNTEGITYYVLPAGQTFDLRAGTVYGTIQSALVVTAPLSGAGTASSPLVISNIPNSALAHSTIVVNGTTLTLGDAADTVAAAAGTLTGTTLASGVTASSLTSAAGGAFGTGAYQPQTVLTGTSNEISVTNSGVGATTLSTPQAIGTGSSVQFAQVGIGTVNSTAGTIALIQGSNASIFGRNDLTTEFISIFNNGVGMHLHIGGSVSNPGFVYNDSGGVLNLGATTESTSLSIATSGAVTCASTVAGVSFNTTSSRRFKDNIASLDAGYALARVTQLRPVTFDWKPGQAKKGHDFGLIAEEVQEVFPQVVSRDEKGEISGLDYGKLSTVLIASVQAQQREINVLMGLVTFLAAGTGCLLFAFLRRR
jgi:hypothetical protein